MDYRDKTITGERVMLDGNTFTGCTFEKCRLVFKAMDVCTLGACRFIDCGWEFEGPAATALKFLTALYHGGGEAARKVVESTFENIRKG